MDPRPQAYDFEHIVLRDAVLEDPIMFLWASRLPDAAKKLQNIWRRCAGDGPSIDADALTVWVDARVPLSTIVVSLPAPAAITECYFVAAFIAVPIELVEQLDREHQAVPAQDALDRALKVLVGTTDHHQRSTWNVPAVFFTLERGEGPSGALRTVLGQWQRQEDGEVHHLNFGDGPRPDRDAFLAAVAAILRQPAPAAEPADA